jgi:hypothetical protein
MSFKHGAVDSLWYKEASVKDGKVALQIPLV